MLVTMDRTFSYFLMFDILITYIVLVILVYVNVCKRRVHRYAV